MEAIDKKAFLIQFNELDYAKCYFKFLNGMECQGWILDIYETTFEYLDSGPMARDEHYIFNIEDIDTSTFSYFDDTIKKWVDYKL